MTLSVGDRLPEASFMTMTADGPTKLTTDDVFKGKTVALFAVPGAFTPTCSAQHLPGFIEKAGDLKAKGVDEIVCVSVNDAFVMGAWAEAHGAGDDVKLLADGNAEFTRAVGLDFDGSNFGMGLRSQRYAAVIDDGVVSHLAVEAPMKFEVSSAEAILAAL